MTVYETRACWLLSLCITVADLKRYRNRQTAANERTVTVAWSEAVVNISSVENYKALCHMLMLDDIILNRRFDLCIIIYLIYIYIHIIYIIYISYLYIIFTMFFTHCSPIYWIRL